MSTPGEQDLLPVANGTETWRWLRVELRERRGTVAVTLLVGLLGATASVIPAYVMGILVDRVREQSGTAVIVAVAVAITLSALVGGAATGVTSYLVARLGGQVLAVLRHTSGGSRAGPARRRSRCRSP
jgi:ATP-binding cassette subfamily C protein